MYFPTIIFFAVLDIWDLYMLRSVLYEFLMGNTSKKNYRVIKSAKRSLRDKITLSYIRDHIWDDGEKRSFGRYHLYYIIAMALVPTKFILSLICGYLWPSSTRYVLVIYIISLIINIYAWDHERDPSTKFTPHAYKKHPHPQKKAKNKKNDPVH